LRAKCLGRIVIDVEELFERQRQEGGSGECYCGPNVLSTPLTEIADIVLSLVNDNGKTTKGLLTVHVVEHNPSAVISALEQARDPNRKTQLSVADVQEPSLDLTNLVLSRNKEPVRNSLLNKLETLLQVGDEVAKV
jgi:hypothetical protein